MADQDPAALAREVLNYPALPEKVKLARAVLALTEERDALRERLRECCATFDGFIPDRNCSCHINAPCCDCADWGGPRQVIDKARAALRGKGGT